MHTDDEIGHLALIGTVEELAASPRTQTLVREQFETNFFGPVNVLKAAIPAMRKRNSGHIMILTGISACSLWIRYARCANVQM